MGAGGSGARLRLAAAENSRMSWLAILIVVYLLVAWGRGCSPR